MRHIILLCSLMLLPCDFARPVAWKSSIQNFIKTYLERYFPFTNKEIKQTLAEHIKKMQEFYHLKVTGIINDETVEIMKQPRCGMPDVAEYSTFQGSPKWKKKSLTYRMINSTSDLPKHKVVSAITKAWKVWSDVIPLSFTKTTKPADIEIFFASGDHGDTYPFDGKGGVLAHAFAPAEGIGGDAHFDEDEDWSDTNQGTNLFIVAAHEFGHSLGLSHSNVRGALMYPTYTYKDPETYRLPADDKKGIQKLYGRRT